MTDVNAAIVNEVMGILAKFGVRFPGDGSDSDAIHAQAAQYRQHADQVQQTYTQARSLLNSVDWTGGAGDAHAQLVAQHVQLANHTTDQLTQAATHLDDHASKAGKIVRTIVGIALEILEIWIATLVLSIFAGWLAELIFWARAGWLIARAIELCQAFRQLVSSAVEVMRGVGATAGKVAEYAEQLLTTWLPAYVADTGSLYFGFMTPELLSGKGLSNAKQVFVGTLLPFIGIDFAGYFGLHLLERETKFGARIKSTVDNLGKTQSGDIELPELAQQPAGDVAHASDAPLDLASSDTESIESWHTAASEAADDEAGPSDTESIESWHTAASEANDDGASTVDAVPADLPPSPGEAPSDVEFPAVRTVSDHSGPAEEPGVVAEPGAAEEEPEAEAAAPAEEHEQTPAEVPSGESDGQPASLVTALPPDSVIYGAAKEFLVTGVGNTILNAAGGDTKPGDLAWGFLGGGAFAAGDKAIRQGFVLPLAMTRKPAGVSDDVWLATVGMVLKTAIRSTRFTLRAPFTDLVTGANINTQLGSLPTR